MADDSRPMADDSEGLRRRITRSGEDALGRLAQDLLENPLVHGAIARAFEAREKAAQAQEVAMGALNLPSAADIERVTRRLRSLSQRLEGIEDALDRLDDRVGAPAGGAGDDRLGRIESRLDEITRDIAALAQLLAPGGEPMPRAQERLTVRDS
jgi:chromosome segregation ATPase